MSEALDPASKPARTRPWWVGVLTAAGIVALFAWVLSGVAAQADQLDFTHLIERPRSLGVAASLWASAFLARAWMWGEMMRRSGYPVAHVGAARVFLAAHLGRFVPGKTWSVLAAGLFGRRLGVSGAACAVHMTVFLVLYYMLGNLLALLVVGSLLSEGQRLAAVLVSVLGLALLGFVTTPLFPRLLHFLGDKLGRDLTGVHLPPGRVLVPVALGLSAVWVAGGFAFMFLTESLLPAHVQTPRPMLFLGTYAAALVAGFVVLLAPSGLGVREAVMTLLLTPSLGAGYAGLVAVACRIVLICLELSLSLWGIWPQLRTSPAKG